MALDTFNLSSDISMYCFKQTEGNKTHYDKNYSNIFQGEKLPNIILENDKYDRL